MLLYETYGGFKRPGGGFGETERLVWGFIDGTDGQRGRFCYFLLFLYIRFSFLV
jgi:hypothetical protein